MTTNIVTNDNDTKKKLPSSEENEFTTKYWRRDPQDYSKMPELKVGKIFSTPYTTTSLTKIEKPDSIEVTENAKGQWTFKVKIYFDSEDGLLAANIRAESIVQDLKLRFKSI